MAVTAPHTDDSKTNAIRPDVLAAEADLNQSKADLKLQKAMRIPDPTFSFLVEHNPPAAGRQRTRWASAFHFHCRFGISTVAEIKSAEAAVDKNAFALAKAKAQAACGYRQRSRPPMAKPRND